MAVVVVSKTVSFEEEEMFLHHVMTNECRYKFTSIDYVVKTYFGDDHKNLNIVLVLGDLGNGTQHIVLSIKQLNFYNKMLTSNEVSLKEHISNVLLYTSRLAVPECGKKSIARVKNKNTTKKLSIVKNKYRTNRTGGALGNMNGELVSDIREKLFSGETMNHIPKTTLGQITVPYYKNQKSKIITKMKSYYMSVKTTDKVCSPPKVARPTMGWIIGCKSFFNKYTELCFIKKEFKKEYIDNGIYVQVIKELIFAPYNMALLLERINLQFGDLFINPTSYGDTLNKLFNELHCNRTFNNNNIIKDGRLSFVLESTAGHRDNYTGNTKREEKKYLESKITLCDGRSNQFASEVIDHNFVDVMLPSGTLGYPLFSIYTNCCPLLDIETHALQDIVHLSLKEFSNSYRTSVISAFDIDSKGNESFNQLLYKKGCAVTFVPI